jgi:hypothetical protein
MDDNYKELDTKEIEVTISLSLSKTVKIKVNDYFIKEQGLDEDNQYYEVIDYSECNLHKAVEEQIYLPHQINSIKSLPGVYIPHQVSRDLENWIVDDFEVIKECE